MSEIRAIRSKSTVSQSYGWVSGSRTRFLDAFSHMLKSRILTHEPFFLAHAVTYACNSRCKTCTYWQMSPRMENDLPTEEVYSLLDDAYDFGMRGYYLFGGEPLIRKDIEDVVEYACKRGFLTTMNTNGSLLEAKAESLGKNLDFAFVSLDYFNEHNDFIRGRPGAFKDVLRGIERIREVGRTRVTLVTTISKLNFEAMEPMAKLAQKLGVGISYNAVEPTVKSSFEEGRSDSPVRDYGLSREQIQTFYETLLRLKMEGYPLMETANVLKHYASGKTFTCHFPKIFIYVSPDKKAFNCTYDHVYDLKKGSFKDYFASSLYKTHVEKAEKCNICLRTCVRMYSYAYALKPLYFISLLSDIKILANQRQVTEEKLTP
ncbi:MAG: radical SAM protein [Candidatus Bathyarchaeota archaeon]